MRGPGVGVRFTKMSGAGNDFIVIEEEEARRLGDGLGRWTRAVCRRGLSVGADGVLVVVPGGPGRVGVTFLNPDGEPAFCGNGSRCAARHAHRRGFATGSMVLATSIGDVPAEVVGTDVRLRLPVPTDLGGLVLDTASGRHEGRHVLAGVPHFVVVVVDLSRAPLATIGPEIRRHARFAPAGTNVDFVERLAAGTIRIRTWERGVEGETLSCGSGAVAAAFAAHIEGGRREFEVVPASGIRLRVVFPAERTAPAGAVLEGDARIVFEGELDPEAVAGESA